MKILVVDDEPLVRKSLARASRSKGHEVVEALDGLDGLEKWMAFRPEIVFLDVLMPGLSGPELLKEVMQKFAALGDAKLMGRVILMSAYSGEHNVTTAQQLGADLFVPKPFDDVFAMIAKAEDLHG